MDCPYRQSAYPKYNRVKKKLPSLLRHKLNEIENIITSNPSLGTEKQLDLKGIRIYKFKLLGQLVLLAYQVDENNKEVIFVAVGGHENFYRDLKNYLKWPIDINTAGIIECDCHGWLVAGNNVSLAVTRCGQNRWEWKFLYPYFILLSSNILPTITYFNKYIISQLSLTIPLFVYCEERSDAAISSTATHILFLSLSIARSRATRQSHPLPPTLFLITRF